MVFAAGALIALGALAAYRNSLSGQFAFDDVPTIIDNPTIRRLWDLKSVLSPPPGGYTVSGRPLLNLSLAINYALGGKSVWGYHATNLAIHILAGLTLLGIVRRTLLRGQASYCDIAQRDITIRGLTPSLAPLHLSFIVALIWTVHPLQTESVTYVIQRAESLMGLFYFLTLYGFIRYSEKSAGASFALPRSRDGASADEDAGRWWWGCLSIGACVFGMATKEVMVSAPVIVLLYDRCFVSGSFGAALRRRGYYYSALALTWVPLVCLALGTGTRGRTAGVDVGVNPVSYWLTQFHAIAHYLFLVFWPRPLVLDYGTDLAQSAWSVLRYIGIVGLLVAGTVYALVCPSLSPGDHFGRKALGFCGFLFFAILAPTSLIPVVVQVMAEHRMYVALAPVVAVAVIGSYSLLTRLLSKAGRSGSPIRLFIPLCIGAAFGLGFITTRRNEDYRNELTLWGKTAAESPDNPRALYNYGLALSNVGRIPAAMDYYKRALAIKPDYPEAHNNLGIALSDTDHWRESIVEYKEAVRLDPGFGKAYYNLGNAYLHLGRLTDAIGYFEEARRINPDNPDIYYNLGIALTKAGRPEDAIPVYQQALVLKPDYTFVQNNLGAVLDKTGHLSEAIVHYREALRLDPTLAKTHNDLGTALARTGQIEEATGEFEQALRLDPNFYLARLNLGHAFMLTGRAAEAQAQFEQAARLRSTQPNPEP